MKFLKAFSIAFILSFPFQLISQSLIIGNAESVGVSAEKLTDIERFIQKYMITQAIPGGTFLIARKGKIIFHKSFGLHELNGTETYKNDDIYRLASMTKAVTTVATMQLVERGMLGLDDPIHYYIPAFKKMQIATDLNEQDSTYNLKPATKEITVRHLLTHTSGITYGVFRPGAIQHMYDKYGCNQFGLYHDSLNTKEMVEQIATAPLLFEPGEKWEYGLNMEVLGRVIEVASKTKLGAYFKKNIFDPLGMNDTRFYHPVEKAGRIVPIYTYNEKGGWIMAESNEAFGNVDYPISEDNGHYAGGGGLSGTAIDYAVFIQTLLNEGKYNGKRILGRKAIETIASDQLVAQNRIGNGISKVPGVTFGLGFRLYADEGEGASMKSVGTYEWGGYFNTKFFIDPKEELIFVGMSQIVPFQRPDFWDRMYNMIYASIID